MKARKAEFFRIKSSIAPKPKKGRRMKKVYLLIGIPASGKSYVCEKVSHKFCYVRHDDYMKGGYVEAVARAAKQSEKPVLCETPFSISQIKEPLERMGLKVEPVFIIEPDEVVSDRWATRNQGRRIVPGHLTRQRTYQERAQSWGAFQGTSSEVLKHLQEI